MRPTALIPALAVGLAMTGAAAAASNPPPPPPAPPPPVQAAPTTAPGDIDLPPAADDQAEADRMTAQLAAVDASLRSEELRMTALRNAELAKENARILAIRPALPFRGDAWFTGWL